MSTDERLERARRRYEAATFGGDSSGLAAAEADLDGVEAELALTRGKIIHSRFLEQRGSGGAAAEDPREVELFTRASVLFRAAGDVRGEAESLFWIGCFLQVVRGDEAIAIPYLERSRELAAQAGDKLTISYALRHLGFTEYSAGRFDEARQMFEESTRLRREVGFLPGVAANLIALGEVVGEQDGQAAGLALITEAEAIARECGARGVLGWAAEARAELESSARSG